MEMTGAILLAVICVVIGFLLGALLISLLRESTHQVPPQELLRSESDELRVWHRGKDRRLMVMLDGVSYQRDTDLKPEQSRRLIGYIREMQTWM